MDILLIQETHKMGTDGLRNWLDNIGYDIYLNAANDTRRFDGTAIMVKNHLRGKILRDYVIHPYRAQCICVQMEQCPIAIMNIYGPAGSSTAARKERTKLLSEIEVEMNRVDTPIIFGGDFNFITEPIDTKSKARFHVRKEVRHFKKMLLDTQSSDVFRHKRPLAEVYTYISHHGRRRIDRIYVTNELLEHVTFAGHENNYVADHISPTATLTFDKEDRWHRPGWKCNNDILKDKTYRDIICNVIDTEVSSIENFDSLPKWWDALKLRIANASKRYQIKRNINPEPHTRYQQAKGKIKMLTKLDNFEGEQNTTRQFWTQFKKRKQRTKIKELQLSNGKVSESKNEIANEIKTFYSALWTRIADDNQANQADYLTAYNAATSQTSMREKTTINPIHQEEVWHTIRNMKREKTPGRDGLTVEFYITFWDKIGRKLTHLINNAILFSNMPESWDKAKIILIHKNKEKSKLENWRPISILNVDYKIMAKILNQRLTTEVEASINKSQKAGLPRRYMNTIHNNVNSVKGHYNGKQKEAYIMTIDASKAFDKVNHQQLIGILERLPTTRTTLRAIKKIYSNPTAVIEINGLEIAEISCTRGIRQGCPLSMSLYAISADPLAQKIEANQAIDGLKIGAVTQKIDQFADDVTLYIGSITAISEVLSEYQSHYRATGQDINREKTEILPLNRKSKEILRNSQHAAMMKPSIKILGIHHGESDIEKNHAALMIKIEDSARAIKPKNLSWIGKIKAIKSYIMSKITYIYFNIQVTHQHLKQMERVIFGVLWHPEKLEQKARNTLVKPMEHGGIGMPDIASTIETRNAKRLQELARIEAPAELWHAEAIYNLGTMVRTINAKLYNNSYPHRSKPTSKWEKEKDIYVTLKNDDTPTEDLRQKEIYDILLKRKTNHGEQESTIWRKIWLYEDDVKQRINNKQRVISFRINSEAYFTGARKIDAGWTVKNAQQIKNDCKFCKNPEDSMNHIFSKCPTYQKLFYIIRSDLEDEFRTDINATPEQILRNDYDGQHRSTILSTFMKMKTSMWEWKKTLDINNEYADDVTGHIDDIRTKLHPTRRRQWDRG